MPLTWNEIELRSQAFASDWAGASYEKGEAQSFYNDFFDIFGVKRRSVARFEEHVARHGRSGGFIDLFWPGVLLVEHKSAGGDLARAAAQAGDYFDALPEGTKPRYQLVCDFKTFQLVDRDAATEVAFELADLHKNIHQFSFILGKQRPVRQAKEPVSREATAKVSAIYKSLVRSKYPDDHLEKFLTRLVFCLFADDTGIFQPRGCFADLIEARTAADGSDLGRWLADIFQVLDTRGERRQTGLDPDLAQLTYINGDLFSDTIAIATCDNSVRDHLVAACQFDWAEVSPAIFGSLFQSVLDKKERRRLGGHFTSESNILKVCNALFLDRLRKEFEAISRPGSIRVDALKAFQRRLRSMMFFDPACGCGNFLAVAYRELRLIELKVIQELHNLGAADLGSPELSLVDVDQFFGIEVQRYSARIAETAMWMTDHIANNELSLTLGVDYHRVPLKKKPSIVVGDALALDWRTVVRPGENVCILGNPPYGGAKFQKKVHRKQVRAIANLGGSGGTLDYVCGWLIKAGEYASEGSSIGLVAVNSVIHGEQAGQLWPILFERYSLELTFAHRDFLWDSTGPGKPRVQVVILGLAHNSRAPETRRIWEYANPAGGPTLKECKAISPYLIPGEALRDHHLVVKEVPHAINGFRKLVTGTKPIDGGYYILSDEERAELLAAEPGAEKYIRPFIGGQQFLAGESRHILVLKDAQPQDLRALPRVKNLVSKVADYRGGRIRNKDGKKLLDKPNPLRTKPLKFHITVIPQEPFLVVPEVSSERRLYVPIAWLKPPIVPSNLVKVLRQASLAEFGLLTSSMHMAWLRGIGGRLEGRLRYSIQLVYNTFPVPREADLSVLDDAAQDIVSVRAAHPGASLEDLYDPDAMPLDLKRAHAALDRLVDRIYMGRVATDEQGRLENLLARYERSVSS